MTAQKTAALTWESIEVPADLARAPEQHAFDIRACVVYGDDAGLAAHRAYLARASRHVGLARASAEAKERARQAEREWAAAYEAGDTERCLMAAAAWRIARDDQADADFRPAGAAKLLMEPSRRLDEDMARRTWQRAALAARLLPQAELLALPGQALPAGMPGVAKLQGIAKPVADLKASARSAARAITEGESSPHLVNRARKEREEALAALAGLGIPTEEG